MPRGRPRRTVLPSDDDDSGSESEVTFTQNRTKSQSQAATSSQADLQSSEKIKEYVTKTVKMILPYAVSKYPVKRAEITNQAMNGEQRVTSQVIAKAKEVLQAVYQMDLVELQHSSIKQYIVVGLQPAVTIEEYTEEQQPELVLLYLILEYIFMKSGEVLDGTLYAYLSQFEIQMDEEHDYFGDVKHLIHDVFTKQHYLTFVKNVSEGSNVEKITVKWGERAKNEFNKREILNFIANKLDCSPNEFLNQYEEAYGAPIEEELEMEVQNLIMSSQPKRNNRRGRVSLPQEMEIDSD